MKILKIEFILHCLSTVLRINRGDVCFLELVGLDYCEIFYVYLYWYRQFNDSAKKINDSPETEQVTEMVSLVSI